jgi:hypothetical protein
MTGLQESFYIIGIIFMSLMFILILFLLISVFVIRAKINRIHDQIEARIDAVTMMAEKSGALAGLAAKGVARQAKKAMNKK